MEDNSKKIKQYLLEQKYKECVQIIEKQIINYVVNLIRKKEPTYEYMSLMDLIEDSKIYIEDENKYIAEKIKFADTEEDLIRLERLILLCETYNIKLI
jgi:hypothetical protein